MTQVLAPPSTDVADILSNLGVDIRKVGEREISGVCPVHERVTGRADTHPSWSINADTGLWLCFSCGARGTLPMLISELSGEEVDTVTIQKMLVTNGFNRLTREPEEKASSLDVSHFFDFTRVPQKRCALRNLDPQLTFMYGVRWNSDNKTWAIPIMNQTGRLEGWQEKKSGYVRNLPVGVEKSATLFGIERFRSKTAVLVESPLDVIRFAGVFSRPQALASFGAFVSTAQLNMLVHVADKVVIALDNDKAGREATRQISSRMPYPRRGIRFWNYRGIDAKDIGDMTDDEIERGMLTATTLPPWIL